MHRHDKFRDYSGLYENYRGSSSRVPDLCPTCRHLSMINIHGSPLDGTKPWMRNDHRFCRTCHPYECKFCGRYWGASDERD